MKIYPFPDHPAKKLPIVLNLYSHDEENHMHDYIELVYILSGRGIHYVDDVPYLLHRGSLLYIDDGQIHRYTVIDNMSYVNFKIRPEYFSEKLENERTMDSVLSLPYFYESSDKRKRFQLAQFEGHTCSRVEQLVFEMIEENMSCAPGYETLMKNDIINLLLYMQRNLVFEASLLPLADIPEKLKEAIAFIDQNIGEKITLKQVSELCHYSQGYFSKLLKQYFGSGFSEYLMKKRVNKAMYYLLMTDVSILEISMLTGFTNKTHFYKTFKKLIGVQPSLIKNYQINYDAMIESSIKQQESVMKETFDL